MKLSLVLLFLSLPAQAQIGAINTFPGGTSGQIQYNNGGRFGGAPGLSTATVAAMGVSTGSLRADFSAFVSTAGPLVATLGQSTATLSASTASVYAALQSTGSALTIETARATAAEATKAPLTGGGTSGTWPISVTGAASLNVLKAGDTMTGRLTAPDATLTYGLTAATGSFSGSVTASSVTATGTGTNLYTGAYNSAVTSQFGSALLGSWAAASSYMALQNSNLSTANGNQAVLQDNTGITYVGAVTGKALIFREGTTENARFATGGSLGLLTQTPATTLDVNGNAQFGSGATKSTFTATGVLTTVQSGLTVGNSAATTANISTLMNGLGAASNNVISFIRSGSAERVLAQTNANDLVFGWDPASYTTANLNTSAKMIIKNDGSVGIGTASPCSTCTLHVAGGASVTGAFAVASATFTVAASGIVSAPSQPFVRALDYGQNLASGLNRMYFSAPAAGSDPASMWGGAASSGTFTTPTGGGGFYAIGVSFICTTQHAYGFQIKVNGSVVKQTTYAGVAGQDGASVEVKIKLNAGDTVEAFAYSDTNGVTTAGANFGSFEMVKLW